MALVILLIQSAVSYYYNSQYTSLIRQGNEAAQTVVRSQDLISLLGNVAESTERVIQDWQGTAEQGTYEVAYEALTKGLSTLGE